MPKQIKKKKHEIKFKQSLLNFFSLSNIAQITIFLLYFIAIVSFLTGIFTSANWSEGEFSRGFISSNIILPFLAISLSFAIQIISLAVNNEKIRKIAVQHSEDMEDKSKFLSALENCRLGSGYRRNLLSKLVEEWDINLSKLSKGIMVIHRDFWEVCSEVYEFSKRGGEIETTSLLPLAEWKNNKKLEQYNKFLKKLIDNNNVNVSRTFIFRKEYLEKEFENKDNIEEFCKLVRKHIVMGFNLWFIILDDISNDEIRNNLETDFALMDDNILMIGVYPDRSVYSYEFYDLNALITEHINANDYDFRLARKVFTNFNEMCNGESPKLLLTSINSISGQPFQKPIEIFEYFSPSQKIAIISTKEKNNV